MRRSRDDKPSMSILCGQWRVRHHGHGTTASRDPNLMRVTRRYYLPKLGSARPVRRSGRIAISRASTNHCIEAMQVSRMCTSTCSLYGPANRQSIYKPQTSRPCPDFAGKLKQFIRPRHKSLQPPPQPYYIPSAPHIPLTEQHDVYHSAAPSQFHNNTFPISFSHFHSHPTVIPPPPLYPLFGPLYLTYYDTKHLVLQVHHRNVQSTLSTSQS